VVNGRPVVEEGLLPIGSPGRMGDFKATAGTDEYIIFPSALPLAVHGNVGMDVLHDLSRVHNQNLVGRVDFRLQPWSGIGRVK
jgi:hypothetical protein